MGNDAATLDPLAEGYLPFRAVRQPPLPGGDAGFEQRGNNRRSDAAQLSPDLGRRLPVDDVLGMKEAGVREPVVSRISKRYRGFRLGTKS